MRVKVGFDGYYAVRSFRMMLARRTWLSFLVLCSFNLNAAVFAQQRISISKKDASGEEIFRHIRQVSNYSFIYDADAIASIPPLTLDVKEATIDQVMRAFLKNTDFTYVVENNTVIIRSRGNTRMQQRQQQAKPIPVSGTVTDSKKTPIMGVTVKLKGTSLMTVTDRSGQYSLSIPENTEAPVLVFSLVGMKSQEIAYTGKNTINVVLQDDVQDLKDVVITGIFNKPKESYTGAVREISEEELKQFQGRNIFTTLGNIDPSFYVVPDNNLGSDPNRIPEIQIRGARSLPNVDQLQDVTSATLNAPLIILDGFETTLQRMMDLDNNQIASITLLKDGSATALYGSRGANGIVVIKTKEPVAGKLRLTYRAETNLSVPDLSSYHLLNSRDKLELERLSGYFQNPTKTPEANIRMEQYYNQLLAEVAKGVDTYWLSKPLRTQLDQIHNLKVEGGDPAFRYDLALQYNNINGVMKESGRRSYNGTINLSYNYRDLTFRNNLVIGNTQSHESPYGSFADYVRLNPYWKPYDSEGRVVQFFTPYSYDYIVQFNGYSGPIPNPLFDATLNTYDKSSYTSVINNFQLEWRPVQSLFLRGGVGINSINNDRDVFLPAAHSAFAGYSENDIFRKGSYSYSSGKGFNYTANLSASYSNLFGDIHRVYIGVNLDMTENTNKQYTFDVEGFPDESIDLPAMALQYKQDATPSGIEATTRRVGVVGNLNYALKDRYLVDVAYRVDGASQFGSNRRFAPFWSAGLGWNMHYEPFIRDNLSFVNLLKLRGSYGSTGTTQFSAYQSLATYSYILGDRYKTWLGARQNGLGNSDLEWQQTDKYNVGVELDLFNSRLSFEGNVFLEKTSNLLSSLDLPYSNGFTSYYENIGKLEQRGFELTANVWLFRSNQRRFSWSVSGNIVHNKDKIVELSEAMKAANERLSQEDGTVPNRFVREGDSRNTIYVVRSLGIDPSTGREVFLNKEGGVTYTWNWNNRVAAGLDQPKYRGNFSTLLRYGNATINASFRFRFGGQLYNQTLIDRVENANRLFNVDERVFTDRWIKPGDRTFFRGINEFQAVYASSRFVQDEATLICQNVNLSYELNNKRWLQQAGIKLLTITANTGELFYVSTVRQERGLDYPFTRQFSLALYAAF